MSDEKVIDKENLETEQKENSPIQNGKQKKKKRFIAAVIIIVILSLGALSIYLLDPIAKVGSTVSKVKAQAKKASGIDEMLDMEYYFKSDGSLDKAKVPPLFKNKMLEGMKKRIALAIEKKDITRRQGDELSSALGIG